MSTEEVLALAHSKLGAYDSQNCPLCGQSQPLVFPGIETNADNPEKCNIYRNKGYSFCNCNNIFFTDWRNIDQTKYGKDYSEKYNKPETYKAVRQFAQYYIPRLAGGKTFLEIGAASNIVLDVAKENGFETTGLDINEFSGIKTDRHNFIVGNFEDIEVKNKYDVIWASHVFEHFKQPLEMIKRCKDLLNNNGFLFIAMPDPWFINHRIIRQHPQTWAHFHLREHYILWDMDSFIDKVVPLGFECVYSKRNGGIEFYIHGDYHLIFQKC